MSQLHVLVDGANLRGAMQRLGDERLDARRFREWAQDFGGTAEGAVTIEWFQASYPGMASFYDHLRQAGIKLVTREPRRLPDGSRKANMDTEIAWAAAHAATSASTLVLVSGDGDFLPLVNCMLDLGIRVILLSGQAELDARYREALPEPDLLLLEDELHWFALPLAQRSA